MEFTFTYSDVDVAYNSKNDKWEFQLRGRLRNADSPAKAKEAIDKEPAEKKKPFPRFKVYQLNRYAGTKNRRKVVEVTSIAEDGYFWGVDTFRTDAPYARGNGRSKENKRVLIAITPENDALFAQIDSVEAAIAELERQSDDLYTRLQHIQIPEGF